MAKKKSKQKNKVTKKTVSKKVVARPAKKLIIHKTSRCCFGSTLTNLAIWIGIIAGIFWMLFGLVGSLAESFATLTSLINGLVVGGVILITTWLAYKFKQVGSILFIIEGIFAVSMLFWKTVSPTSGIVSGAILLGAPLLVSGILRLMDKQ